MLGTDQQLAGRAFGHLVQRFGIDDPRFPGGDEPAHRARRRLAVERGDGDADGLGRAEDLVDR